MKVLKFNKDLCSLCGDCEKACAKLYFKDESREKAALRVDSDTEHKDKAVMKTCIQCGECINVCPVGALYRAKNGVVLINRKICVGCMACVGFCPHSVMYYHRDSTEPFKCISCGTCVKACSASALSLEEEQVPAGV